MQENDGVRKLKDVTNELLMELVELCNCHYAAENITEESFVCFPSSEDYVTFRAQLGSTSGADSTTLLSLIEGWVSTGPTIRVSGMLRRVDKDCSVAISDFSEGECVMPDPASSQSDNTVGIVGGIVGGVVLISAMTFATVLVVILFMRRHRRDFRIEQPEE